MEYDDTCIFCQYQKKGERLEKNEYAFAKLDKYPVTEGHILIILNWHVKDFFEITKLERNAVFDLIDIRKKQLTEKDPSIRFKDPREEFRIAYYMIAEKPRMRGKWAWGQFAPMMTAEEMRMFFEKARKKGWI
jgi:hypothetical protein